MRCASWLLAPLLLACSSSGFDSEDDPIPSGNEAGLEQPSAGNGPRAPAPSPSPSQPQPMPAATQSGTAPATASNEPAMPTDPPSTESEEESSANEPTETSEDPEGPATPQDDIDAPSPGDVESVATPNLAGDCTHLPAVDDYASPGPFTDAEMFTSVGPNSNYTLFRPVGSLGQDGFKHPIATWGNGITTTPDQYRSTLTFLATHGFVIIACNDTQAERPCLSDGLDWLIEQNSGTSELADKLDTEREVTIGYSWGGGAAIDTANRPNVKATVSLHGMPPREETAFADMHAPLFLLTSTGDSFVSKSEYVTPNYEESKVQTLYTTLDDQTAGHLYVVDEGAATCLGAVLGLGDCRGAIDERAPVVAWLRYWACDDERAGQFFLGDDCTLCGAPWTDTRIKNQPELP